MANTIKRDQFFDQLSKNLRFHILDYLSEDELNDVTDYDDLYEQLDEKGAFNIEIIYYKNAIEYLEKHDPSLNESLSLADEYGYSVDDLNSEILASLLASQNARIEFGDLQTEIDEYLKV